MQKISNSNHIDKNNTQPMIVIEQIPTLSDVTKIQALCDSSLSEKYNYFTFVNFFLNHNKTSLVARIKGRVVGVILGYKQGKIGIVSVLCVDKKFRRKGYAKLMFEKLENIFHELGCISLQLETEYDNHASLAFYNKMGMECTFLYERCYKNLKGAIKLKKNIYYY